MTSDRGAATVLAVTLAAALLLVGTAASWVTATFASRRAAESAADLAALAGAAAAQRGEDACRRVAQVAAANAAEVVDCRPSGSDVWVTVEVPAPQLMGRRTAALGRAHAGPAE